MPLSTDPEKRARQLANLRPAPPAPAGHRRSLVHGGRSELLMRDVESEVRELMDALGAAAPVRDPASNGVPAADVVAIESAARALKRYRHLAGWLDTHGRIVERTGAVKPAAELELRAERALNEALDRLGMNPSARARLSLDLARTHRTLEDEAADARGAWQQPAVDASAEDVD